MKTVTRTVCLLLAFAACAWAQGAGGAKSPAAATKAEQEIRRVEERRFRAMTGVDTAELKEILADDLIYTHSSGVVDTKEQFIASLTSGRTKYKSIDIEEMRVRLYGETRVVNGRARVRVESQGRENNLHLRFMDVYVKRGGRWQMVAWQSTRLTE